MAGKYEWQYLSDCNLSDHFFNSLRSDYPGFNNWFTKKAIQQKKAFIYTDEEGIGAFVMFKESEHEKIILAEHTLEAKDRFKISTLKLSKRIQGNRMGEGALGITLWHWQNSNTDEIYVTVFEKHVPLIQLLKRFGFKLAGHKENMECVYIRSKKAVDYSTPYTCFPFVNSNFKKAGTLPIESQWHDTLFPYSELKNTLQKSDEIAASNGISKVYIGFPYSIPSFIKGEPVFIYRKSNISPAKYHSAMTSLCTITDLKYVKKNNTYLMSFEEYISAVKNKSVFSQKELFSIYNYQSRNILIIEMIYNCAFGAGNNVNYEVLSKGGFFNGHPYQHEHSISDLKSILILGKQDPDNIIL